ncbi:MAG: PepSY-like domain-containing protein [Bacteroidota bacterium]|nr:PepSY-like domain-containing protein [Bacteroidota bacterium]
MKVFKSLVLFSLVVFAISCTREDAVIDESDNLESYDLNEELLASAIYEGNDQRAASRERPRHPAGKAMLIVFTDLPQIAQVYLLTNTDTNKINKIIKITRKDGTIGYAVAMEDRIYFCFDAVGNLLQPAKKLHKEEIELSSLPLLVQEYLDSKGATVKIAHIYKLTGPNGKFFYVIRLENGFALFFNEAGERIKTPVLFKRRK